MIEGEKTFVNAMKNVLTEEELKDPFLYKVFDLMPYLDILFSGKEIADPRFLKYISKISEYVKEFWCLDILEKMEDAIKRDPQGEEKARKILDEIIRNQYKPSDHRDYTKTLAIVEIILEPITDTIQ